METNSVELRDCIEELLRFTLESRLNDTADYELELSRDFCSDLLKDDPNPTEKPPLYKLLARALHGFITSGELSEAHCKLGLFNDDNYLRKTEYNKLLHDTGSELAFMLKNVDFELHVQEPYFTQLKGGLKTVEGRCAVGDYMKIRPGNLILFNKCLVLEVKDVHHYASFSEMLEAEGLAKVLPGVKSIEEGIQVYRKFYTEEKERTNGVLGILIAKQDVQPYISLAKILSVLSYTGIKSLLADHIAGTAL